MAINTLVIRITSPKELIKNVEVVFPRPLITLSSAELVYKNGHIQAKVIMNLPAIELPNKTVPIQFPKIRKRRQHPRPSIKQEPATFFIIFIISLRLLVVWISATVGISMMEMELVIAEGNRMQGRAIPVSTP